MEPVTQIGPCWPKSFAYTGLALIFSAASMMDGNATELLAGNDRWKGPGGESVLQDGDRDLLVFHAYDAKDGRRTLQISTLTWDNDWPHAALETRQP